MLLSERKQCFQMMKQQIKEAFLVVMNKFHFPAVLPTSPLWLFLTDLALVFSRNTGKIRFCHCSQNTWSKNEIPAMHGLLKGVC